MTDQLVRDAARIERIDSPRDPRVADYVELRDADRARKRGVFIAEGLEVVRVMLTRSRYEPRSVLLAERHLARLAPALAAAPELPIYLAPDSVLSEIAGFDLHRGCLAAGALGTLPSLDEVLAATSPGARVFVVEGIANHDNVGALFRNAACFGVEALLLDPGCADPLYRKAIRVSMGHALTVPWTRLPDWTGSLDRLRAAGFELWALTLDSGAEDLTTRAAPDGGEKVALLLGTEGTGLSAGALAAATRRVRIPMAPGVDSLNVATAAAIAAFAIRAW